MNNDEQAESERDELAVLNVRYYTLQQLIDALTALRDREGASTRVTILSGARQEIDIADVHVWTAGPLIELEGVENGQRFVVIGGTR